MKKLWSVGFVLGAVFAVGLFSLIGGAFAASYMSQDVNYPIYIDNVLFTPNTPAQNVQGSTYLPLRAMSEALGVKIEWDGEARKVYVYKNLDEKTKDVPDIIMWNYINNNTISLLNVQQSSALTSNIDESNDQYKVEFIYYTGGNANDSGTFDGKINVNFTTGDFELLHAEGNSPVTYKGKIDNSFNATVTSKDGGSDSTCKTYIKEKLDEYRNVFLKDKWNINLIGLIPSDMKTKKMIEYIK